MARKKTTTQGTRTDEALNTKGKQLVIVESPAKARTINNYLGQDFFVMASVGHVRDLPAKNPKGIKDPVPGVDLDHNFRPTYQIIKVKAKNVAQLKHAAHDASGIWLATDLDREGEAIAWHLAEALKIKPELANRVVFNAITKAEIQKAFLHPKRIDTGKVNAQQARRILDRIVGYQVSPLLWKKIAGGLSAGRVQSVAARLIVEREREIAAFVPVEYWKVAGYFTTELENAASLIKEWQQWLDDAPEKPNGRKHNARTIREKNEWLTEHKSLSSELIKIDGKKFEPKSIKTALAAAKRAGFELEEQIEAHPPDARGLSQRIIRIRGHVAGGPEWSVTSLQKKLTKSHPFAPFITSTVQQTAANQLGFTAQFTMRTAQELYEGVPIQKMGSIGLITYMRTDSTHLSAEAIKMARDYIHEQFGDHYLPAKANVFSSPNKAAQEAHEAIRPTDISLTPDRVHSSLTDRQYKLYKIIWERFVACQMTDAQWHSSTILISGSAGGGELVFRSIGRALAFDGYYRVAGMPNALDEPVVPPIEQGQALSALQIDPIQHFTSSPPRYTEASLVKKLEAEGIGRPSTYAQIIQVIQDRKYAEKIQNRFHATELGEVVTDKLIEAFPEILEVGYTRDMEQQLDNIEEKHADWVQMLHDFYGPFKQSLEAAYQGMEHAKAETQPAPHICPQCGSSTVYRFGRNGRFLSCSTYPACKFASPIDRNGNPVAPEVTDIACPKCAAPMLLRNGRFGPFLSCSKYPECNGILNLDKKGCLSPPKIPPLRAELPCPKCSAPLNLRRSARGPWLSCSKFPKCRGRQSWTSLPDKIKAEWEKALKEHEKAHPQIVIRTLDGTPVSDNYKPQAQDFEENKAGE